MSADSLLAVGEFQKLVRFVMIYDITLTPQAQRNKVLEGWMAKAGIPMANGIVIDQKLTNEILAARFVGDARIAADARGNLPDQVEMLFVRGTGRQINAVGSEYLTGGLRAQGNQDVRIRLDLVVAPKDLFIFLQLNKAAGLDLAEMKADPTKLKSASAFPIRFPFPLHTVAAAEPDPELALALATDLGPGIAFADLAQAQTPSAPAAPGAAAVPAATPDQPEPEGSVGWDDPSQALIIIRRLKQDPKVNLKK
jgi:hypothetical protein